MPKRKHHHLTANGEIVMQEWERDGHTICSMCASAYLWLYAHICQVDKDYTGIWLLPLQQQRQHRRWRPYFDMRDNVEMFSGEKSFHSQFETGIVRNQSSQHIVLHNVAHIIKNNFFQISSNRQFLLWNFLLIKFSACVLARARESGFNVWISRKTMWWWLVVQSRK